MRWLLPLLLATLLAAGEAGSIAPLLDQAGAGAGIQRTMTLLATSTPQRRNHVRILFYGQSITQQDWWKAVVDDLRSRFPHADLEAENRAIGGFASQWLERTFDADVVPWYPDLVIFHVYGGNQEYERIIRGMRARTTAEVLIQTDHLTSWPPPVRDEADLRRLDKEDHGAWWDHRMNHEFVPGIARQYGCGLVDVRGEWGRHLKANGLQPKDLLADNVHLNEKGCHVMAGIIRQYLVHRPDLDDSNWRGLVDEQVVGAGVRWQDGVLRLPFAGDRVVAIAGPAEQPVAMTFTIDGLPPSQLPGCRSVTRAAPGPWSPLFARRIDHEAPLLLEDWTLTVTGPATDGKGWDFTVAGSQTCDDGAGCTARDFRSTSGRVLIAAKDWFMPARAPLAAGFRMTWSVAPLHADRAGLRQADPARETAVVIAQGLAAGPHVLEVRCAGDPGTALRAIRIHRPPAP